MENPSEKSSLPGSNPISSLKKAFKQLSWALLGLRFLFVEPRELNRLRTDAKAPRFPELLVGSIASFLLLVNILGLSGGYDNLLAIGSSAIEEPIVVPEEMPLDQGSVEEPTHDLYRVSSHAEGNDNGELIGVPAKIWKEAKHFLFTAYLLLAFPGVLIVLSVLGLKLMVNENEQTASSLAFSEAVEYVWYQTLCLLVVTALLAAGIAIVWQFADAVVKILSFGQGWLIEQFPFLAALGTGPQVIMSFGEFIDGTSFLPGLIILFSLLAVFTGFLSLVWHTLPPRLRWLSPIALGAPFAFYVSPLYALRFVPWLSWIWFVAVWVFSGFLALAWLPVLAYALVVLGLKLLLGWFDRKVSAAG